MTPSAADRVRARRRALLQRRLLVLARRTERLGGDEPAPEPRGGTSPPTSSP